MTATDPFTKKRYSIYSCRNFVKPVRGWTNIKVLSCSECGRTLSRGYCYIIGKLKEQNLLPNDFSKLCCYCHQNLETEKEKRMFEGLFF